GALPPGVPFLCVGRGSNLLVADEGFAGVAVLLDGPLAELAIDPDPTDPGRAAVMAGGGVRLPVLARQAAAAGWGGVEFFAGIPGSVGGAVPPRSARSNRSTSPTGTRTSARPRWCCGPSSPSPPAPPRSARRRSTKWCGGGGPISPAATTPGRCSPTRPATPPAVSSTPAARRASGSAP